MSKDTKAKLLSLPEGIIKRVLAFFTAKELLCPLSELSRRFHALATDPVLITKAFFSAIKVPYSYGGAEFGALSQTEKVNIMRDILWPSGINEKVVVFPYFTDGGVQGKDSKFFITNIYTDNPPNLYCSKRGSDVHIKGVFSDIVSAHVDLTDIAQYKMPPEKASTTMYPEDTYCLPIKKILDTHEPQHSKTFAVIKYHDLNRNLSGYTCFMQSFALFISMEEIDVYHPLVQLFNGVRKMDQLESLGFEFISLQSEEASKVVEFQLGSVKKVEQVLQKHKPGAKLNGVYPFLWGDVSATVNNYLNIVQRIGCRYTLLKLIDSHKATPEGNIDCYNIAVSGNMVRLKHTNEE